MATKTETPAAAPEAAPAISFSEVDIPKVSRIRKEKPNPFLAVFPTEKALQTVLPATNEAEEKIIRQTVAMARRAAAAKDVGLRTQRHDDDGKATLLFWTAPKRAPKA